MNSLLQKTQRTLVWVGVSLLTFYVAAEVHSAVSSRVALWAFQNATAVAKVEANSAGAKDDVDFSLWSVKRIAAYKEALALKMNPPLAVLSIPKLKLTAPVYEGTDDLTLNRGVGRIVGTTRLGENGNTGIAGHRDGFFRGLKDIANGDVVELDTGKERATYVVDGIEIVDPTDVHVLEPRAVAGITLVTCYPFYFVGDAPNRYIVHASLKEESKADKVATN